MSQASVSRAKAVRALKNNQNDIVNAIMVCIGVLVFFSVALILFTKSFNNHVYRGVRNPMKILDIGFLKAAPNSKFKN